MRVVAVLGGGGAKCIAHPGAWKALQEVGAEIVHVIGTSMGAVVGAALAGGRSPESVLHTAASLLAKDVAAVDWLSLARGMFATSLLKPEALRRTIARFVSERSFAALKLPLTVTVTDLDTGDLALFGAPVAEAGPIRHLGDQVPLVDALYASCALPLYFDPMLLSDRRLADGGLRAVLPIDFAMSVAADLVVAIDVGPGFDETPAPGTRSLAPPLIRAHGVAIRIMMAAQTERAISRWPAGAPRLIVVRAVAEREATFALGQSKRYFDAGYETTKEALRATFGA